MFSKKRCIMLILFASRAAIAGLQVPNMLSDGVVFQQMSPVKIWGSGTTGSTVTVTLILADDLSVVDTNSAQVDADGRWQVSLDGQAASYAKYSLRIEDGQDVIEIQNVLFGEVWMASGQSNMNLELKYVSNSQEIESAINAAGNEYVRGLNSKEAIVLGSTACSQTPLDNIPGAHWGIASNFNGVADLSGVGVTFALKLFETLNQNGAEVPIAILSETRGGTSIEAWLSYETMQSSSALMEKYPAEWSGSGDLKSDFNQATACYNHLISPLVNFHIAGILWYQGENNAGNEASGAYYRKALAALVESWRTEFTSPNAAAFAVQLAPEHYWDSNLVSASFIREAQDEALRLDVDPAGAAIPIHDLELMWRSNTYPQDSPIHPLAKQEVGIRLANAAYAVEYGGDIEYLGPVYESMDPKNGGLEIRFAHTSGGLATVTGTGDTLRGFSICGKDRVFYPASAEITGSNTVLLSSKQVLVPVAATYGFSSLNQYANLSNGVGLPARPFRTDKVESVHNVPLQWMHCDTLTNWYNIKTDAYFTNTWNAGSGVSALSLSDEKLEGDAALRVDYSSQAAESNRVMVSPVLDVGDLQLDKYSGMQLSLYKPGNETINLTVVFTAGDGSRHRLRNSLESYGSLPVSGSGWKNLLFSFDAPHLDSDGVTTSPAESLSTIQKLEFVLESPAEGPNESYIIIDQVQLVRVSVSKRIQFGGLVASITNVNWQSQIGSDEIIQWNGVNSRGGSYGASGTLVNQGVGAQLASLGNDVVLTCQDISSTNVSGTNTMTYLDALGIKGGDNAKFDALNDEKWTFDFSRTVVMKQLIIAGLNVDSEAVEVVVEGVCTNTFTRLDEDMALVSWESNNSRYVYTFSENGIVVPAETRISLKSTDGQWGLVGIVVELSAESLTDYNAWAAGWGIANETETDDSDGDGLKNLYEFAVGGDPTDPEDQGIRPTLSMVGDHFLYGYPRRAESQSGLSYYVEKTDHLLSPAWTNAGYPVEVFSSNGLFDFVASEITPDQSTAFFRLVVQ